MSLPPMLSEPSPIDRSAFRLNFSLLDRLLALFVEPDGEDDRQLIAGYLSAASNQGLAQALAQGRRFLSQTELPWTLIPDAANRSLPTEDATRRWLEEILERLAVEQHTREAICKGRPSTKLESPET